MSELAPSPPWQLALPEFEGPLDLLLHLLQKHELDVFDIPVVFVTERYLEYLSTMHALDLELAAEYLVMAATLAHLKSRMLVPSSTDVEDPEAPRVDGEDPRAQLVRRLLEYQKFKSAAEALAARGILGRDVFLRGSQEPGPEGPAALSPLPLVALLDALDRLFKRRKLALAHEVLAERVSIAERIQELVETLRGPRTARFEDLFEGAWSPLDLVVTFLALLEMARLRMVRLEQTGERSALQVTLVLTEVGAEEPEA